METLTDHESLLSQLRRVLKDALDYLNSLLKLQQVRLTALGLSASLFLVQLVVASFLAAVAFILINVALGVWLSQALGNPLWSLLILGGTYALLAWLTARKALRWLKQITS